MDALIEKHGWVAALECNGKLADIIMFVNCNVNGSYGRTSSKRASLWGIVIYTT